MTKKLISIGFLTVFLLGAYALKAQPNRKDNIRQMKIAFFTDKLQLTTEEAQVFWPVYNAYSKELEAVRKARRQMTGNLKQKMLSSSDQELEKLADDFISSNQEEMEISNKYYAKFKKVLPIRKVIMLIHAEEQWKQKLITIIQERRRERRENRFGNP